jgi:uncharacterized phage protein (TIGR01671 family)
MKFRAYLKESYLFSTNRSYLKDAYLYKPDFDKKMLDVKSIHFGTRKIIVSHRGGNISISFDDVELMQWIGLRDKNFREIYVGDVTELLAENGKINRHIVKFGIVRRKMDSGWVVDIPSFYFDLIGSNFQAYPIVNNYMGMHDLQIMSVIGNIYENPSLMEE